MVTFIRYYLFYKYENLFTINEFPDNLTRVNSVEKILLEIFVTASPIDKSDAELIMVALQFLGAEFMIHANEKIRNSIGGK